MGVKQHLLLQFWEIMHLWRRHGRTPACLQRQSFMLMDIFNLVGSLLEPATNHESWEPVDSSTSVNTTVVVASEDTKEKGVANVTESLASILLGKLEDSAEEFSRAEVQLSLLESDLKSLMLFLTLATIASRGSSVVA